MMQSRSHSYPLVTDADYLSLLTRKLFHSGFNKALVDKKWPDFHDAFAGFEPAVVGAFGTMDICRLQEDARIVRHRKKIRATIHHARHFCEMAELHGTWRSWFHGLRSQTYARRESTLKSSFEYCGPNTIFYFLYEAGEVDLTHRPPAVR